MKTTLVVATLLFMVIGCTNRTEELENQNAKLQTMNNMLTQDLDSRDAYIEEVTLSINDVYHSLESVRAKEKSILSGTEELNPNKTLTSAQVRQNVKNEIVSIGEELKSNRGKISDLESKLKTSKNQYAGLNKMVTNLKHTLEEREQTLTQMYGKIKDLEFDVAQKTQLVSEKEATIVQQQSVINTGYYIIGTRDELEKLGVIKDDGGFLWGLLGSATILGSGFDNSNFKPIDKTTDASIEVAGKIDEILPKRSEEFYDKMHEEGNKTSLKIKQPEKFWQDKYLVIVIS